MKLLYKETTQLLLIACIGLLGLWESFKPIRIPLESETAPVQILAPQGMRAQEVSLPALSASARLARLDEPSAESLWSSGDSLQIGLH